MEYFIEYTRRVYNMTPVTIKKNGNKGTVKIVTSLTNLLTSVRSKQISPEKGTQNKPHLDVRLPRPVTRKWKKSS